MDALPLELIISALAAVVLLFMLYNVLGKRTGRQPEDVEPTPAPQAAGAGPAVAPEAAFTAGLEPATAEGAAQLRARDPGFEPARFLDGARHAYESIVTAYAAGDRETLRPLLADRVFSSFEKGILEREAQGTTERAEVTQGPRADLDHLEADGDLARVRVRFLAEIRKEIEHEGVSTVEERRTAELWTFERRIGAADPNWVLTRVEAAQA